MNYRLTSAAEEEFATATSYLLEESLDAATSFVEEVTSAIERIAQSPTRYAVYSEGIRVRRLKIHPYSIFYEVHSDHVLILTISHDARAAEHWRDRT